jgi:hypothetical protein
MSVGDSLQPSICLAAGIFVEHCAASGDSLQLLLPLLQLASQQYSRAESVQGVLPPGDRRPLGVLDCLSSSASRAHLSSLEAASIADAPAEKARPAASKQHKRRKALVSYGCCTAQCVPRVPQQRHNCRHRCRRCGLQRLRRRAR